MQIALYKGKGFISNAIKFITRSPYSHAAFRFDAGANKAAEGIYRSYQLSEKLHFWGMGAVVEAWSGGVQNSLSISSLHERGTKVDVFEMVTPLTEEQEKQLVLFCADIIGWPYSYWNVLKFITKQQGKVDGSYFCSEAVFEGWLKAGIKLLNGKQAWEVPPDWLSMPTLLHKVEQLVTM